MAEYGERRAAALTLDRWSALDAFLGRRLMVAGAVYRVTTVGAYLDRVDDGEVGAAGATGTDRRAAGPSRRDRLVRRRQVVLKLDEPVCAVRTPHGRAVSEPGPVRRLVVPMGVLTDAIEHGLVEEV